VPGRNVIAQGSSNVSCSVTSNSWVSGTGLTDALAGSGDATAEPLADADGEGEDGAETLGATADGESAGESSMGEQAARSRAVAAGRRSRVLMPRR